MINPGKSYFKTRLNSKGRETGKMLEKNFFSYLAFFYLSSLYGPENITNRHPKIPVSIMRLIRTTVNLNVQIFSGIHNLFFFISCNILLWRINLSLIFEMVHLWIVQLSPNFIVCDYGKNRNSLCQDTSSFQKGFQTKWMQNVDISWSTDYHNNFY